jgi:CubicO group peptidase (beta-lactamase class C family)
MTRTLPPHALPRSTPAEQQADPAAILAFLDAVEARPDIEMHSLMVVRNGHVIAAGWWAPYSPDRRHFLYSLSKSFTSTAAGFAQAEGLLDLDDPVVKHFPEFESDITDPRSRAIKIRHVAAMASGHTRDMAGEALSHDPDEPVRGFLLVPPDREPGSVFAYSQPCTYTLASIIQRNAGMPLTEYLRPRLFDPLGIGPVGWQTWPPGRQQGFSGLFARTEDIAKLGLLYLRRGRWQGRQLLPAGWVAEATAKQVDNADQENPDWRQGYGFQFWRARHGYRGDGAFGQFCVVLPEQDTVVASTAYTHDMQAVLDALWEHLLPGLDAAGPPVSPAAVAQQELTARLAGLALPAAGGAPAPAHWAEWTGAPFAIAAIVASDPGDTVGGTGFGGPIRSPVSSVTVAQAGDAWELTLADAGNSLTFPAGSGTWAVSTPADRHGHPVPVAASGGWDPAGTLRAEVIFLETPHRLEITGTLPARTGTARWLTPPLGHRTLDDLRCPD